MRTTVKMLEGSSLNKFIYISVRTRHGFLTALASIHTHALLSMHVLCALLLLNMDAFNKETPLCSHFAFTPQ